MTCPKCQTRWADFPVDITKQRMTRKQEVDRLAILNNDIYCLCPNCQTDLKGE